MGARAYARKLAFLNSKKEDFYPKPPEGMEEKWIGWQEGNGWPNGKSAPNKTDAEESHDEVDEH